MMYVKGFSVAGALSTLGGLLVYFQFWTILNEAGVNILVYMFFDGYAHLFLLGIYLGVELAGS